MWRGNVIVTKYVDLDTLLEMFIDTRCKIVFTNGCFDIIHPGHIKLLREAKSYGDVLIVAVNTDESVSRLKGDLRPIFRLEDRISVLSEMESVDYILSFDQDTPIYLIKRIRPRVIVKGGDYKPEAVVGSEFIMKYGGEVKIVDFLNQMSTTLLISKILKNG